MTIKKFCFPLVFLLILFLICGASLADEIVIGEVSSLSGRFAQPGGSIHQGVELAVHEANLAGGVDGKTIRLITRDDGGDPQKAIEAAEALCLKQNAVALTGGYVDSLVGPVAAVAEKYRVPYVAAASLQTKLTELKRDYFFRISNLQGYVNPMAEVVASSGARKIAIIHSTTPGATELSSLLSKDLSDKGLSLVSLEKFKPGTSDFTPLFLKVFDNDPEVLISLGFFQDNLLMVKQLKENNISPKLFFGAFGMEYQSLIDDLGGDSDYLLGSTAWEPGINVPGTEDVAEKYLNLFKEKFGQDPEPLTMHGYTSAMVVIEALKRLSGSGKAITGAVLKEYIRQTDLSLPMEKVKFDEHGEPLYYTRYIFQIMDGKRSIIYPPEVAKSNLKYPASPWSRRK